MRPGKRAAVLAAAALMLLTVATGAQAITNGQPDNGRHPYVGLMVALDKNGVPLWRCSGSLLSPTVFLTAGHCTTAPAARAQIWFEEGPVLTDPVYAAAAQAAAPNPVSCDTVAGVTGYPCVGDVGGIPHLNPGFCNPCGHGASNFAQHDVGVVTLGTPRTALPAQHATLPAPAFVDSLANKSPVDLVGYGVEFQAQIPGNQLPQPPPFYRWTGPRERNYAPSEILTGKFQGSDEHLKVALNPGGGSGGTCFGDSGGPILGGGTTTVLGVNSYGGINCAGTSYAERVDLPDILSWIRSFMS